MASSDSHRLSVILCLLILSAVVAINAYADEVENLIRNGGFEEGIIDWELRVGEGAAATLREITGQDVFHGNSCALIEIDNVAGTSAWHLALYQEGHQLEEGTTYTLGFWGKADGFRPVALYVEQAADPWDEYGRIGVEVGEEWEEFTTTFTAAAAGPVWPRIALGESDIDIWVDNVRLYEGEYVEEDLGQPQMAVDPAGKLPVTWAGIKK